MQFLIDLFNQLNTQKISYSVLRNYDLLPESTGGSDLDILIGKNHTEKFISIVNEIAITLEGRIVSVIYSEICPRICLLGKNDGGWGVMIDLHYDKITYHGHTIFTEEVIWENTFLHRDKIYALNNKINVLNSLLKELINNKTCTRKYFEDFKNAPIDSLFLCEIFNKIKKPELVSLFLESKNREYSTNDIKHLGKVLNKVFPKKRFTILTKLSKLSRLFKKPGFTVAFIGTDGSGKSTIIAQIEPVLNDAFHKAIYYEHMRPNWIPSIAKLMGKIEDFSNIVNNPHGSKTSGFVGSLLRWCYYMIDYTFGFYIKIWPRKATRASVCLFDRYYYDYLIDPKRGRIKLPSFLFKLGQLIIPEPDLILCLGTKAKVIHKRKPELPLVEVEKQTRKLKRFCDTNKKTVWIDTGTSVEKSTTASLDAIINMMAKRFENVKL